MAVSRITRTYQNFLGVDFSDNDVLLNRSPDALNLWKDYSDNVGATVQTRPDFVLNEAYPSSVYGIYFYKPNTVTYKVVHSGTTLYSTELPSGTRTTIYTGLNPAKTQFFVFNSVLYIMDGLNYLEYDGATCKQVVGYVPTTSIARKPSGGGTTYEDVNMLTGERINTFVGDGVSVDYYLDTTSLDTFSEVIRINDGAPLTKGVDFTVDTALGKITFTTAPSVPATTGQANVSIWFKKTVSGYRDRIAKCTIAVVFDNRVFFSGNQNYPNVLFHSSLNNPRYCSDLDYYNEGLDLAKIKAVLPGNNALWVIKEPSPSQNSIFYHQPVVDSTYGKIYPSQHSNISTGCVSKGINFGDDICFFSERGMEAVNGEIGSEKVISHRSSLVDGKLLGETTYLNPVLEEYAGYLMVFTGTHVYLADSRQMFQNISHFEYEWYYWEIAEAPICTVVKDNVLYIGTATGIYTLTNYAPEITSYWATPEDEFGSPNLRKTTSKRGALVDFDGTTLSLDVSKDGQAFTEIGTYTNTKGYIVFKTKQKKFKSMQLRFRATSPIKLYSATIEAYYGNYVKR